MPSCLDWSVQDFVLASIGSLLFAVVSGFPQSVDKLAPKRIWPALQLSCYNWLGGSAGQATSRAEHGAHIKRPTAA